MSEEILRRSFRADLERGEGRTVYGRVVPYNVTASVADGPTLPVYKERFVRGSFNRATRAPNRVFLRFEHQQGFGDIVGLGQTAEEQEDGLDMSFRVFEDTDGDRALEMIEAGTFPGFSVGFWPIGKGRVLEDGTKVRTRCHLDEVSLVRKPAYAGAEPHVRDQSLIRPDLEQFRPKPNPELDERIAKVLGSGEGG